VHAAKIIERSVGLYHETSAYAGVDDFIQIIDNQRGMSTLCGVKIGLNSKMKIHWTRDEPDTVASCHFRWLCDFRQTEDSAVELTRACFAAYGNGDLHVIEIKDWHKLPAVPRVRPQPKATRKNSYHAGPRRETSAPRAGIKL
jgi:hypothetical protein